MKIHMNSTSICLFFVIFSVMIAVIDAFIERPTILWVLYIPMFICSMVKLFKDD